MPINPGYAWSHWHPSSPASSVTAMATQNKYDLDPPERGRSLSRRSSSKSSSGVLVTPVTNSMPAVASLDTPAPRLIRSSSRSSRRSSNVIKDDVAISVILTEDEYKAIVRYRLERDAAASRAGTSAPAIVPGVISLGPPRRVSRSPTYIARSRSRSSSPRRYPPAPPIIRRAISPAPARRVPGGPTYIERSRSRSSILIGERERSHSPSLRPHDTPPMHPPVAMPNISPAPSLRGRSRSYSRAPTRAPSRCHTSLSQDFPAHPPVTMPIISPAPSPRGRSRSRSQPPTRCLTPLSQGVPAYYEQRPPSILTRTPSPPSVATHGRPLPHGRSRSRSWPPTRSPPPPPQGVPGVPAYYEQRPPGIPARTPSPPSVATHGRPLPRGRSRSRSWSPIRGPISPPQGVPAYYEQRPPSIPARTPSPPSVATHVRPPPGGRSRYHSPDIPRSRSWSSARALPAINPARTHSPSPPRSGRSHAAISILPRRSRSRSRPHESRSRSPPPITIPVIIPGFPPRVVAYDRPPVRGRYLSLSSSRSPIRVPILSPHPHTTTYNGTRVAISPHRRSRSRSPVFDKPHSVSRRLRTPSPPRIAMYGGPPIPISITPRGRSRSRSRRSRSSPRRSVGPAIVVEDLPRLVGGSQIFPAPLYSAHPRFWHEDGNITVIVEQTEYKLHQYLFKNSIYFQRRGGIGRGTHLPLSETRQDFDRLLSVLYPEDYTQHECRTVEEWASVLALAHKFEMHNIRQLAIDRLALCAGPVDKIALGQQYDVDEWLAPAYLILAARQEPITSAEGAKLGVEALVRIGALKDEVSRNLAAYLDQDKFRELYAKKAAA